MTTTEPALVPAVLAWFDVHERDLPWRDTTAWGVLVSEFMLQQTPVSRVLPVWQEWLERWPEPAALAASPVSDALRAWGRLGYPRRARRLHEASATIVARHHGAVPRDEADLLALPGVGQYTAAAVRAFAYGERSVVLDVNVRRVLARATEAKAQPAAHLTADERAAADLLWPSAAARSARWSAAVMELGALVCTARQPRCDACPISGECSWLDAGSPSAPAPRRQAAYEGSDRQARGRVMACLRNSRASVPPEQVHALWHDADQLQRAVDSLIADGLVERLRSGRLRLPAS